RSTSCATSPASASSASPNGTLCGTRWSRRSSLPTSASERAGMRRPTVTVTTRGRRLPTLADRVARRGPRLLAALRLPGAALSRMLVSDSVMRRLNRDWRGRDRPTDVLSFAQREGPGGAPDGLLGDVVISVDTARRQAAGRAEPLAHELDRLLIH